MSSISAFPWLCTCTLHNDISSHLTLLLFPFPLPAVYYRALVNFTNSFTFSPELEDIDSAAFQEISAAVVDTVCIILYDQFQTTRYPTCHINLYLFRESTRVNVKLENKPILLDLLTGCDVASCMCLSVIEDVCLSHSLNLITSGYQEPRLSMWSSSSNDRFLYQNYYWKKCNTK